MINAKLVDLPMDPNIKLVALTKENLILIFEIQKVSWLAKLPH